MNEKNNNEAYHIVDCIIEFLNHYESYIIERKKKMTIKGDIIDDDNEVKDQEDGAFMINAFQMTVGIINYMIYMYFCQLTNFKSMRDPSILILK